LKTGTIATATLPAVTQRIQGEDWCHLSNKIRLIIVSSSRSRNVHEIQGSCLRDSWKTLKNLLSCVKWRRVYWYKLTDSSQKFNAWTFTAN